MHLAIFFVLIISLLSSEDTSGSPERNPSLPDLREGSTFADALSAPRLNAAPPFSRASAPSAEAMPNAGPSPNPLASFDEQMEAYMRPRRIPGGALAVTRNGRLVYAKGYGWADRDNQTPVRPDSLFRIASLSKPITALAILKMAEASQINLEASAFGILDLNVFRRPGQAPDLRLQMITIRHLLQHAGGWDREKGFDPMFQSRKIADTLGVPSPPNSTDIVRYLLGQSLDFEPGARYAYSNFGYCVLGRIIEKISGQPYDVFVKQTVLQPLGITRMRLGASLPAGRANGEVHYYTAENTMGPSVFPGTANQVPLPYGTFCLEAMDAHGGWLASAVDLVRIVATLEKDPNHALLQSGSKKIMFAPPPAPLWRANDGKLKDYYYACGWMVRPHGKNGKPNYWHTGSLPGAYTLLVHRGDGLGWAVLFNQRSTNPELPDQAIDGALHRAADAVATWPDTDSFPQFH